MARRIQPQTAQRICLLFLLFFALLFPHPSPFSPPPLARHLAATESQLTSLSMRHLDAVAASSFMPIFIHSPPPSLFPTPSLDSFACYCLFAALF